MSNIKLLISNEIPNVNSKIIRHLTLNNLKID